MSNDHDPQIQAWLRSEDAPEHRNGFWDELRGDIDDGDVAPVVSLDRARRHAPWLLVAAAAIVVAAVAGFGVLRDRGDDVDVTTEPGIDDAEPDATDPTPNTTPDTIPDTTPDTTPDGDLGPLVAAGDATERGSGRVVAVSPDGNWLYVTDDAGDDEFGCEGSPRLALYVEPVEGGERRLAAPVEQFNATTVSSLHFDGQGLMAAVVQCEGHNATIVTATTTDDGTLTDFGERTIPETDCPGTVDGIYDIAFVGRGELLAATNTWSDGADACLRLYSLPTSTADATVLGGSDVYQVEVSPDGRIVTASMGGAIAVDGDVILADEQGAVAGLAISPSGRTVAVSGDGGDGVDDVVISLDDTSQAPFASDAYEVALVDDVNGIMTAELAGQRVVATFRAGEPDAATPLVTGNVSGFVVTPTADRVFATVTDDNGENATIVEVPLTR